MKRLSHAILRVVSSRAMPLLVIGFFFFLYIGIAFFTDEALITLMAFTRNSIVLAVLLAAIPLNSFLRLGRETGMYLKMRRMLGGKSTDILPELFDEVVELPVSSAFPELQKRLAASTYKTRWTEGTLSAWRGVSNFPVRMLFLAGMFCLFVGILISITSRSAYRQMVIEGEPFPTPKGDGGTVKRITLAKSSSSILSRTLTIEVAQPGPGSSSRLFGLYPPSLYGGAFVYPRYLGLALLLRFSAPDVPAGLEQQCILNIYPPGKEDNVSIPGSSYRIVFSIPESDAGSDRYLPYVTGNLALQFKLLKGEEVVFTGSAPRGGEFARDGYRLAFPDIRRLVVTDFIGDYGVIFIWAAALFFAVAGCLWLPIRVFFPRREMVFVSAAGITKACSRAEGRARRHAGVFHEALDLIDAKKLGN